jgi:PKD repeat protein
MKAWLRPTFVLGLSIALAATSLASVALAAGDPHITFWAVKEGPVVYEGDRPTVQLAFDDPDLTDVHTVTIDWGDSSSDMYTLPVGARGDLAAVPPVYVELQKTEPYVNESPGTLVIFVSVEDQTSAADGRTLSITVLNATPVFTSFSLSPTDLEAGGAVTATGRFSDGSADSHTVELNWDDGTALTTINLAPGVMEFTTDAHTYDAAGGYTVSATVTDDAGARGDPATATVSVRAPNHAPTGLVFDATATGSSVVVSGSFTDADATDAHTITVTWGDDTPSDSQALLAGEFTFSAPHVYAASKTYTVSVTVNDPAGASTTDSRQVVVTIEASSASDVIDEMSSRVRSFELDRNTERWLLRKLDDLKDSLAYGNTQVCSDTGILSHLMAFADRTLTSEQYATLSALATELEVAAGCTSSGAVSPKVQEAATVTTTLAPAPTQKDTTVKSATTKSTKSASKLTGARGSAH